MHLAYVPTDTSGYVYSGVVIELFLVSLVTALVFRRRGRRSGSR